MMAPTATLTFAILVTLLAIAALGIILKSWLFPMKGKVAVIELVGRGSQHRRRSTVDRGKR